MSNFETGAQPDLFDGLRDAMDGYDPNTGLNPNIRDAIVENESLLIEMLVRDNDRGHEIIRELDDPNLDELTRRRLQNEFNQIQNRPDKCSQVMGKGILARFEKTLKDNLDKGE